MRLALATAAILVLLFALSAGQLASPPRAVSSSSAGDCGNEQLPPKSDGNPWVCTFDDEFDASTGDATAVNTSWWVPQTTAASGFTSGPSNYQACYVDSPNNISVADGYLSLTARKEDAPFTCSWFTTQYTSGMLSTYTNFNQTYGRFEVRAKLPQTTAAGLQETLWLWPIDGNKYGPWPASGEVDFAEFYSDYSSLVVPYIHYNYDSSTTNSASHTNVVTAYCNIDHTQYNDYAVVWSPGHFTITVNGQTCLEDNYVPNGSLTSPQPFDQPFFVILTQALGVYGNAFDPATTPLPATTSVDYVRVWD